MIFDTWNSLKAVSIIKSSILISQTPLQLTLHSHFFALAVEPSHMHHYSLKQKGKGKERCSSFPSFSFSEESLSPSLPNWSQPSKIPHLSSLACVMSMLFSKVASKPSSSKGMASLASLVNSANLSAACKETNLGLIFTSGTSSSWTQSGVKTSKAAKTLVGSVTCHFYLFLLPLFDLCSTSRYFHYFRSLSSIFCLYPVSYDLPKTICLLSSILLFILCLLCIPYSISMFLCSISIIIFLPSVHYSLPSLSNLDNSTFHSLWLCESSFIFSILHHSPYYSKSCSIKLLPILYLLPSL